MRKASAIAGKELSLFFATPWAYVVLTAMTALSSLFFVSLLQNFREIQEVARTNGWARMGPEFAAYRNLTDGVIIQLWEIIAVITLFVAPFISMRLFAEERRQKTFELLMTTPVRPWEIVLGKYLGGLGAVGATLGLTLLFPLLLAGSGSGESGRALEWSTVLLGYFGLLLWGATCVAVGMFISALTESQMLAAFLTFAILLPWMLLRNLAQSSAEPWRSLASYVSFSTELQNLDRGVLDLKALVFFSSVIGFSLFLTHRAVEAQRWT